MFSVEKCFEASIARTFITYLISLSLCTSSCFYDSKKVMLSVKNFSPLYQSAVYLFPCAFVWNCFLWFTSSFCFWLSLRFSFVWLHIIMPCLLRLHINSSWKPQLDFHLFVACTGCSVSQHSGDICCCFYSFRFDSFLFRCY